MAYFRKRGSVWYYTIEVNRADGSRKKVERPGGRTKKEAEATYLQMLENMNRYGKVVKVCDFTLEQYADQWLDDYVRLNLSDNTYTSYKSNLKNHIRPTLGAYKIAEISPNMLQKFINEKSQKYSSGTLHVLIGILKKMFAYAVQPCEYIKTNPALYIEAPKQREEILHEAYVFSKKEIQQIFEKFTAGHDFYMPITIAYYTGLRLGECLALQWSDIDEKNNMLTVRHTLVDKQKPPRLAPPKSKNSRAC